MMELLLVAQQQIAAGEASLAVTALERFFLGVRTLVSLEVFQAGKGALTGGANVRSRLVRLRRWEVGSFCVDGDGRGFCYQVMLAAGPAFAVRHGQKRGSTEHAVWSRTEKRSPIRW